MVTITRLVLNSAIVPGRRTCISNKPISKDELLQTNYHLQLSDLFHTLLTCFVLTSALAPIKSSATRKLPFLQASMSEVCP